MVFCMHFVLANSVPIRKLQAMIINAFLCLVFISYSNKYFADEVCLLLCESSDANDSFGLGKLRSFSLF